MTRKLNLEALRDAAVLVVDDETMITRQITLALEDLVASVHTAADGEAALAILEKEPVDLLVTDIKMPGMNGIALVDRVRQKNLPLKGVIITTAFGETDYFQEAIRLGVDRFLLKPVDVRQLLEAMIHCMEPFLAGKRLKQNADILAVMTLLGGKKIRIIEYLVTRLDKENRFFGTYQEIMDALGVSKVTVVNTFKQLTESGVVTKERNGVYKFNSEMLNG